MAPLRFETVRDVVDAFPIAEHELTIDPTDEPALTFLDRLAGGGELDKAIGFCAYILPRREAVWWGCRSVKTIIPQRDRQEDEVITIAENWVRDPEEERRTAALRLGMERSSRLPTTWLALAAGWSGGNISTDDRVVLPTQPHQTARAVRAAILIAGGRVAMADKPALFHRCIDDGVQIATDAVPHG